MNDVRRLNPGIESIQAGQRLTAPASAGAANGPSFDAVLKSKLQAPSGVRFSAHAQQRLSECTHPFGTAEAARLEAAVERADKKGAKESVVLLDDMALLVSIKNRTVITAVDSSRAKDNVFTNIDSVVIG